MNSSLKQKNTLSYSARNLSSWHKANLTLLLLLVNTVGPRTERILGQEKTRSAQNRSDWGQAYLIKCKNRKKMRSVWGQAYLLCVPFSLRPISNVHFKFNILTMEICWKIVHVNFLINTKLKLFKRHKNWLLISAPFSSYYFYFL